MDRIQILNDALIGTGNSGLNVEYDGSPEWQAAEVAWRRTIQFMLSRHTWNFANTTAPLAGLLPSSPHPIYEYAFALPGDCLLVQSAYFGAAAVAEYEILDQKFCSRFDQDLVIKYVRAPAPDLWPPLFRELVTMKLEAHFLRSFNEDTDNARRRDAEAETLLADIRSQLDRQEPGRAILVSRTARRRRGYGMSV